MLLLVIIRQTFFLACDCPKRVTWLNIPPAKIGKYPSLLNSQPRIMQLILAFWLAHGVSISSHYTYVWPYMEINAANVNFLWEAEFRRQKIGWKKKKIRWAVYRRNTRNYRQCHPSNNKKAKSSGWKYSTVRTR